MSSFVKGPPRPGLVPQSGDPDKPYRWIRGPGGEPQKRERDGGRRKASGQINKDVEVDESQIDIHLRKLWEGGVISPNVRVNGRGISAIANRKGWGKPGSRRISSEQEGLSLLHLKLKAVE